MYDVIIIGSGASGLFLGKLLEDKNILVLEKTNSSGNKLLLTGNGRCNLTNYKDNKELLRQYTYNNKFLYSTINNYNAIDIYNYFNDRVPLKIENSDCVFTKSNKAKDILDSLIIPKIIYNTKVTKIIKRDNSYLVITNNKEYETLNLVCATGGLTYPKTGSEGDIFNFCNDLALNYTKPFPVETSIILKNNPNLAGISFDNVRVTSNKYQYDGHLIFTHKGLSGSAIMKISEHIYLDNLSSINIDFIVNYSLSDFNKLLNSNRDKQIITTLNTILKNRFSEYLLNKLNIDKTKLTKQLIHLEIENIFNQLKTFKFEVFKVEDITSAIITGGGISTKELNPKTFESKKYPNLYFIGECVDMHGPIGGYNLTLAFSSAYSSYKAIINHLDID